ncbi:MAG: amidohydrolase/deacetylase family metallohydrolase [Bryobacter sp.]
MRLIYLLAWMALGLGAQPYDLLLKGGHVIDPKNGVSRVLDVAVAEGIIAKVGPNLPVGQSKKVVDVRGLYVTPGLVDMHVHVYTGTSIAGHYTGDLSVYPDPMSFRSGVTTMVDAGTAGHRVFADFKQRVIDRAKTRVFAFLNIVGGGMGPDGEDDPADMNAAATAATAQKYPGLIVGIKTAHYRGDGWPSVERAVEAGCMAKLPVMVDFGFLNEERNIKILFEEKMRPGDIYTHCFSGNRDEVVDGKVNAAMYTARKRGIFFDVGHGGGSFSWPVAVVAMKEGFAPDTLSSDLHVGSMNGGFKDMPNLMSKFLNLGMRLEDAVAKSTWEPARRIGHEELGHLSEGAEADIAVFRLERGKFGFIDSWGGRLEGTQRLGVELTILGGKVMWDLNGRAATDYRSFPYRLDQYKLPRLP